MNPTNPHVHLPTGAARLAGVMGWPIAHSLSPRLHNYWLQTQGIDGLYAPLPVPPDNLDAVVRVLPKVGFRGWNVTIPHKEAILPLMDHLDESAARLGAVNTVIVRDDGSLEGHNTDGFGFVESLSEAVPGWEQRSRTALLLGAGGAARAIAFALADRGVKSVLISNRTTERAEAIRMDIGKHGIEAETIAFPPAPADLARADLLVNTTALGMTGKDPLDLDFKGLPTGALVADIVYNPLETKLLRQARKCGFVGIDGLGMLLHQARAGFERWFETPVFVTSALRTEILKGLK